MEIKNELTVTSGEVGNGKKREGARKGTQIEDSWAQTMGEGLSVEVWGRQGRGKQWGKGGTTVAEQKFKNVFKKTWQKKRQT